MLMAPVQMRSKRIFSSAYPHFFTFGGSGGINGGRVDDLWLFVSWLRCGVVFFVWRVACRGVPVEYGTYPYVEKKAIYQSDTFVFSMKSIFDPVSVTLAKQV